MARPNKPTQRDRVLQYIKEFGRYGKVVAWMPLPEPYKAESED